MTQYYLIEYLGIRHKKKYIDQCHLRVTIV